MSLNYKVIGKHIREVRQRNHLSQAMLSELVDKTPSYISYIESGIKNMCLTELLLPDLPGCETASQPCKRCVFVMPVRKTSCQTTNRYPRPRTV